MWDRLNSRHRVVSRLLIGILIVAGIFTLLLTTLWFPSEPEPGYSPLSSEPESIHTPPSSEPLKTWAVKITITILYDNNEYDERLSAAWGFSCLVEGLEKTILFDTGGDSSMLLSNMHTLGLNPRKVNAILISHIHYDHVGGLPGFLKENSNVTVYLPKSFPTNIKDNVRSAEAKLIEVHDPVKICEGAYSTGELGTWIMEQSLVVKTPKGLIVITGCAHPGIVEVVREAKRLFNKSIYLVLGGFHLCWMKSLQIGEIIEDLKKEGVEMVAPCHCSGTLARNLFHEVYGDNFIQVGVGSKLELEV